MVEIYWFQIGFFCSDVVLMFYIYYVVCIWIGWQKLDVKYSIFGFFGFCVYVNCMYCGVVLDDLYFDWWLVQIEEKVESC